MNTAEAMTRPDRWLPWQTDSGNYRVGRQVDSAGTIEWHRGRSRYPATRMGPVITFKCHDHAMARAGALNQADAKASAPVSNPLPSISFDPASMRLPEPACIIELRQAVRLCEGFEEWGQSPDHNAADLLLDAARGVLATIDAGASQ